MAKHPNAQSNIVVLISGSGSNLQAIIDAISKGEIHGKISAVISNKPNVYGLERAKKARIPTLVIPHQTFSSREEFDVELAKTVNTYKPNIIVLAGFMRILSEVFVNQFENKLINIHPSLLPKYTGLNTHERAIKAGDNEAGASVHFVVAELDAGPVIIQGTVPILPDDCTETLQKRVLKVEHIIYPRAVQWLSEQRISVENSRVLLDGHISDHQKFNLKC